MMPTGARRLVPLLFASVLALQAPAAAQQTGILTLTQDFGRAVFARCALTVVYNRPPVAGTDRLELHCTPNVRPRRDDVSATRQLSAEEIETVATLADAADLYGGGHTGVYSAAGSEGPFERLEVGRCCGRDDQVVLITTGNATFSTGTRAKLLSLLHDWMRPLVAEVSNRKLR